MTSCDLLVAGAGPAGCAAAVAARAAAPSLQVVVLEVARFPRDKLCGGAITGGGLRELGRAGLALRVPHAVVRHAVLRAGGRALRVPLPRHAAVARRIELDADLAAQARERGAELVEGAALLSLRALPARGSPGTAETSAGPIAFRALVCADGVAGPSRRLLGFAPGELAPLREALVMARRQEDLVFDLDAGVAGYAWRFPCVDAGTEVENAGIYSMARGAPLAPALARWAEGEGLGPLAPEAYALRLFEPGGPVGVEGALLAGDALGADPLAGEGIRYALWSGRVAGSLAARALLQGAPPSPRAYRLRLAASRSGVTLALTARLAARLHLGHARWRRIASDRRVAEAMAALVSGALPTGPMATLAARYLRLREPFRELARPGP